MQILATDIDENAIARAKLGLYPERSLNEIPHEMKRKYFTQEGSQYQISDEIKRTVTFKKHNLLADSFGGPFDLIVCRNVLIYFTEEAKDILYHKFSNALNQVEFFLSEVQSKYLMLGKYGFEVRRYIFSTKEKHS